MGRAVEAVSFGGPEVLHVRQVAEPHAGPGQVRVRVKAAGLNPMDWAFFADEALAAQFGIHPPVGFGYDLAGVVDELGEGTSGFVIGDRVFGGAMSRAAADFAVIDVARDELLHTPDGVDDVTASTLAVAGATASAALSAIDVHAGDTVLVGGASGGVGVFAVQLARIAGARVIGTASKASFDFLRELGAEPVAYGEGLEERVRDLAPSGITAAADLFGTETATAALNLGVDHNRISTIASQDTTLGVRATGGAQAPPGSLARIAELIADKQLVVPIAAQYPIEQVRDAVAEQATRHVRGKIVLVL